MSATVIGADDLKKVFDNASDICINAIKDAINKTAYEVEAEAKQNAPHDHGQLRASIHTNEAHVTSNNVQAEVGTNLNYAIYQEYGTGIYSEFPGASRQPIRAKAGKVLAWTGSDGQKHFAHTVSGVKPKFYMRDAKKQAQPKLTTYMEAALRIITSELAK